MIGLTLCAKKNTRDSYSVIRSVSPISYIQTKERERERDQYTDYFIHKKKKNKKLQELKSARSEMRRQLGWPKLFICIEKEKRKPKEEKDEGARLKLRYRKNSMSSYPTICFILWRNDDNRDNVVE